MTTAEPAVVRINYQRLSARGTVIYSEPCLEDNGTRMTTETDLAPADADRVSKAFWRQALLPEGRRLTRLRKHYFYHEWFDVVAFYDETEALAGYYIDIVTPLRRVDGEYYATDLFLDFWLAPGQPAVELDQDEFDEAAAAGAITPELAAQARATFAQLRGEIAAGVFPARYIDE